MKSLCLLAVCVPMMMNNTGNIVNVPVGDVAYEEDENSIFYKYSGYPSPAKDLDCEDGYIFYNFEVFRANYTTVSDLYLVHTISSFVPGSVAKRNGSDKYKDHKLKHGYVHLLLQMARTDDGGFGGSIMPKAMWPQSTDFQTTISSSYGYNYVFSQSAGLEVGYDMGCGASLKADKSRGLSLSFSKSKATISADPVLSAQFAPETAMEAQWSFQVQNADPVGDTTYTFDLYFLFEMKNDAEGVSSTAFDVLYDVNFCGQHKVMWWYNDCKDYYRTTTIRCHY